VWRTIWTPITQSHNGYIDIYLELGVVGLILLAGVIRETFKGIRASLSADFYYGTLRWVFICLLLLHNVTESSFARPTHLLWFLFLLVAVNVPAPQTVSSRRESRGAQRGLEEMVPLGPRAPE
jgi:O-antigen ligase